MTSKANIPVVLLGPIALEGEPPRGGYQACNQRTIAALRGGGVDVRAMPYPHPYQGGLKKIIEYATGFIAIFFRLLGLKPSVLHLTGLYKHFIYFELLFVAIAKLRHCFVIYDIRAGAMLRYYERLSPIYRLVFRKVLRMADAVMVEGQEYSEFIKGVTGHDPYYLPNHVSIPTNLRSRKGDERSDAKEIRLIFAGRITPRKGVETVLEAAALLRSMGVPTRTLIAGAGDDVYVNGLKQKFDDSSTEWLGPVMPAQVMEIFASGHFFLFPTTHPGEGHSNALTEAMASGCVPIASRNGFNASVISDAGLVLDQSATAVEYAEAVAGIWRSEKWASYSLQATERAFANFETASVVQCLEHEYQRIWSGRK